MITPGQPFSTTVTSTTGDFRVTNNGAEVPFDCTKQTDGSYLIEVDGADVDCPGPLKLETKSGGLWVNIGSWEIGPCDH